MQINENVIKQQMINVFLRGYMNTFRKNDKRVLMRLHEHI